MKNRTLQIFTVFALLASFPWSEVKPTAFDSLVLLIGLWHAGELCVALVQWIASQVDEVEE